MADLSITAASVVPASNAKIDRSGVFGETVTAGQVVVRDPTTQKWVKSDSNSPTAALKEGKGIALNGGAVNQLAFVQEPGGDVTIGATLTPGLAYYLSDTPGGVCPVADVGSGEHVCLVGVAKSASLLGLIFYNTGVTL